MPDLLTLIRDAQTRRDGLRATIAQAQTDLADLDRELAEVREALGLPTETGGIEKQCPVCGQAFIQRSNRQLMCVDCREASPNQAVRAIVTSAGQRAVCQNCGTEFTPKPGSAGKYCSRRCYQNTPRPGKEVLPGGQADPPPPVPDLRAKHLPAAAPLSDDNAAPVSIPERRCATCLKRFTPAGLREYQCPDCAKPKAPTPHRTAAEVDVVQGRDLAIMRQLQNGPRTERQLLEVLPGVTADDVGRALRRLELRERIAKTNTGIWRLA